MTVMGPILVILTILGLPFALGGAVDLLLARTLDKKEAVRHYRRGFILFIAGSGTAVVCGSTLFILLTIADA